MNERELIKRLRDERPAPPAGFEVRQERLLLGLMQKEEPVMKRKMSLGLVLAVVLVLLSVTAFAASLVFSPRVDIARIAEKALEDQYGITDEMLVYFHRTVNENGDGTATVTYTGNWDMNYVLGEYTVTVQGKEAKAVWSHDGEDTDGGLEAEAWGAEQLNEVIRMYRETHETTLYYNKALAIAARHGQEVKNSLYAKDGEKVTEEDFNRKQAELRAKSGLNEEELLSIARQAVQASYGLDAAQMERLAHNPDLSWYEEKGGRVYYEACLVLIQQPSEDPTVWPEYVKMDGEYGVLIDTETGVVEDIFYDAALAGNG
ncbi:MAG: hypothetical protein IJ157_00620 [Clostridia bacterium]|nr:hypothetical protein [Clostridia bacterium]